MKRGPIGKYRRAITTAIPPRTLYGISFVGRSIGELIVQESIVDRTIVTMRALGFRHLPNIDPVIDTRFHNRDLSTEDSIHRNASACAARYHRCTKTSNPVAKQWYTEAGNRLHARFPAIFTEEGQLHDQELRQQIQEQRPTTRDESLPGKNSHDPNYDPDEDQTSSSTTDASSPATPNVETENGFTLITRKRRRPSTGTSKGSQPSITRSTKPSTPQRLRIMEPDQEMTVRTPHARDTLYR
ncbi:unnamed protein product [Agarophyton chilense]